VVLSGLMRLRVLIAELHRRGQAVHERCAVRAKTIQASRAQQRFQHTAIDLLQIEPPAQILEARESTTRRAFDDDRLDRSLPYTANGAEPIADGAIVA